MGDMMLGEVNIPQLNIVNAVLDVTVRKLELFNSMFVKFILKSESCKNKSVGIVFLWLCPLKARKDN